MDSLGLILVLVAITGMAIQSGSCMLSERRPLSVGFLNFVLCIITLFLTIFVCSGAMVIAPEFGTIMVQGSYATWFLRLALVATGALPTICSYRIRQLNDWPAHLWLRLLLGLSIGAWAATRVHLLNPDDLIALHVQMYDVWWPPLAVWLTLCLAETMLALAKIESNVTGYAFASALVAPLARFALVHQELFDPQSRLFWRILEPVSLLLAILFLAQVYCFVRIEERRHRIPSIAAFCVVEVGAAFLFDRAHHTVKLVLDLVPAALLLFGILLSIVGQMLRPDQDARIDPPESRRKALIQSALIHFPIHRLSGIYFAISILIIPLSLTDLFSIGALPRDLEIFIVTFFWLSFSTRLSEGVFSTLPHLFKDGVLYLPTVKRAWQAAASRFSRARDSTVKTAKAFAAGSAWMVAVRSVLLTCLALIGLVAIGEAFNYHKLVVEPFTWKGAGDDSDKVAERVSDGVVNALGNMRRELLPILLVSSPTGIHSSAARVQPAVLDNGAVQTAVAKSNDLKIWNVTIPLSIIVDPVQQVVRGIFSIRVVGGSLHKSSDGKRYVALINSDNGETWKVYGDIPVVEPAQAGSGSGIGAGAKDASAPARAATPTAQKISPEALSKNSGTKPEGPACRDDTGQEDPLEAFIDEAAFDIANSDPSFTSMGLTKNWRAYRYFRMGLHSWNCYRAYNHWSDLQKSILSFRQAVQEDNTFAPAEYRLGIAMQSAGEIEGAVQAFKDSLTANPELIQAQTAEAQTLNTDISASFSRPAIADFPMAVDRSSDVRRLWAGIADLTPSPDNQLDQRAAYFGLCIDFRSNDAIGQKPNKFYLNYFYCSRALALFFRMPLLTRQGTEQKQLEAAILYSLGEILNYHDYKQQSYPVVDAAPAAGQDKQSSWFCVNGFFNDNDRDEQERPRSYIIQGSSLTRHALRYYRQSLALVPDDDYVQCSEAMAQAFLEHNPQKAMARLSQSWAARLAIANALAQKASQYSHQNDERNPFPQLAAFYYNQALLEYQEAIDRSPSNTQALNGYADVFWQWSLDAKNRPIPAPPAGYARPAERYAREAIRVNRLRHDANGESGARDTLGEVLIARGRSEEAVYQLLRSLYPADFSDMETVIEQGSSEGAFLERQTSFDAYGVDEMHWDLAHALICAAASAKTPAVSQDMVREADEQFGVIRDDEFEHELRPFSRTPGAFNPALRMQRCFPPPDAKSDRKYPLALKSISYGSQPGCSALTVVEGKVEDSAEEMPGMALMVVGGYVYGSGQGMSVQLIPPLHQHRFYYAQLTDTENSSPMSPVIAFDVPDDTKNPACPHGHIVLNFKR